MGYERDARTSFEETNQVSFDKRTVERMKDLKQLEESKKQTLYDLIDTYIRDCKTRKAYS